MLHIFIFSSWTHKLGMPIKAKILFKLLSDLHFGTETKPRKCKFAIKFLVGDYVIRPNFGSQNENLDMAAKDLWGGNFCIKCLKRPKEPSS
jgi:hypothetical protein